LIELVKIGIVGHFLGFYKASVESLISGRVIFLFRLSRSCKTLGLVWKKELRPPHGGNSHRVGFHEHQSHFVIDLVPTCGQSVNCLALYLSNACGFISLVRPVRLAEHG
jgi:hypothetical protein